jgi:hypothetical protein
MKCSNPNCGHGIGLVSYQRHWFDKRRFCSKKCRDEFRVEKLRPGPHQPIAGSYYNWLFKNASSQIMTSDYSRKLAQVRPQPRWR